MQTAGVKNVYHSDDVLVDGRIWQTWQLAIFEDSARSESVFCVAEHFQNV